MSKPAKNLSSRSASLSKNRPPPARKEARKILWGPGRQRLKASCKELTLEPGCRGLKEKVCEGVEGFPPRVLQSGAASGAVGAWMALELTFMRNGVHELAMKMF